MPRGKKEEPKTDGGQEINEIEAPVAAVSPIYTNVTLISPSTDVVVIDFGFVAPSYTKPYDIRDYHVARICLPWDAVQSLSEDLQKAIEDHNKEVKAKKD